MKNTIPASRPKSAKIRLVTRQSSDAELDLGLPLRDDHRRPGDQWRAEHLEEEHGLRLDVYRAVGLL